MLKPIICITTIIAFIISVSYVSAEEPTNYCKDPESWEQWEDLILKYPNDREIQTLHALRIGLCLKVEQGTISFEMATELFNQAHERVYRNRVSEQKKKTEKL